MLGIKLWHFMLSFGTVLYSLQAVHSSATVAFDAWVTLALILVARLAPYAP